MKNYESHLIGLAVIAIFTVLFYFLGEIVLPFLIGLGLAYLVNPLVKRIQRLIPNRKLAISVFLVLSLLIISRIVLIFGNQIIRDFKRLNNAFSTFAGQHYEEIDETNRTIKTYIEKIYPAERVQEQLHQGTATAIDSLSTTGLDDLQAAVSGIISFLGPDADESGGQETEPSSSLNWFLIFLTALVYFFYIIYTYGYFERKFERYFDGNFKKKPSVQQFLDDFRRIFLQYFRQRTKVVLISMSIFILAFLLMNIPGAILIGIIAGLLCYITHFHFWALIPLSLSCWVLSLETSTPFWVFFCMVIGVFVLVSILEETFFTPRIMRNFLGLNPAIMIVSFAIWTYVFGSTFGTLIALPLTTVLLIYLDRLLLKLKVNLEETKEE